jgi:hypothetical protein
MGFGIEMPQFGVELGLRTRRDGREVVAEGLGMVSWVVGEALREGRELSGLLTWC